MAKTKKVRIEFKDPDLLSDCDDPDEGTKGFFSRKALKLADYGEYFALELVVDGDLNVISGKFKRA